MSSPTLRQIFKFPNNVEDLKFAPESASISFLIGNALMVFYKHSGGHFVPSCQKVLESVVEVKWTSPDEIEYNPDKSRINLSAHRKRYLETLKKDMPANYTVCQDWKNTTNCKLCETEEAQYSEHEAGNTIREEEDGKFRAKILDQGWVEIWSFESKGTPAGKRVREEQSDFERDSEEVKKVKVGTLEAVPASPETRVLETIPRSEEPIMKSIEIVAVDGPSQTGEQ